jgi:hypothetical protein
MSNTDTLTFLSELFGLVTEGWLTICSKAPNEGLRTAWHTVDSLDAAAENAQSLAAHSDVWFGVATRRDRLGGGLRGGAEHCLEIVGLWRDVDIAGPGHANSTGLPESWDQAMTIVATFPLAPTVVINSGGGAQVWWLFREPLAVIEAGDLLRDWEATWQERAKPYSIDKVGDAARIMRLPGTFNRKLDEPRPVMIVEADWSRRYNPSDIEPHLITAPVVVMPDRREPVERRDKDPELPLDDFNDRAPLSLIFDDWDDWTHVKTKGDEQYWRRPGTTNEHSLTINYRGNGNKLYVFSTSLAPLENNTSYSKVDAWATVKGYDLSDPQVKSAAIAEIRAMGYGAPLPNVEDLVGPDDPVTPDQPIAPVSIDQARVVFRRWLGDEYDMDAIHAVLATAAVERLDGDPLWTLLVSGSGNAKTETVQALSGAGGVVVSTITSDGALLSASPRRERAKDATGGLLRKLGPTGLLVIKDVTSILSMDRNVRSAVLAALREIHDGCWVRNVGTDGGRTLEWNGRLAIVGAVTTAWDRAHDVIASMGDRFVLLRMDSSTGRIAAGLRAVGNTGDEPDMRAELAAAVAGVLATVDKGAAIKLTDAEVARILAAANVVTLARTAVDYDYQGNVIDAHAPEMPTRFAKQLTQIVRGAVAVGMDRDDAMALAIRCARDSMPPLRLSILLDVAAHPASSTQEVRRRLGKPRNTIDRQLQALHMLDVLTCDEVDEGRGMRWRYCLAPGIDPLVFDRSRFVSESTEDLQKRETQRTNTRFSLPHISGHVNAEDILPTTEGEAIAAA